MTRAGSAVDQQLRRITLVEAAVGAGSIDPGCRDGPAGFRESGEVERLRARGLDLHCERPRVPGLGHAESAMEEVVRVSSWVSQATERLAAERSRFIVIGGDHSCGVGTWSGAARALRPAGPIGLIWIDAHIDMHLPETTHSGAINGMPVACLLGEGDPALTAIAGSRPAIDPRHLCLVGIRSFEPEEVETAKRLGVRIIHMDEVRRRGLDAALAEARAIASVGTVGFGVSLDLDAFDPADVPGVGTPAPGGLRAHGFLDLWRALTSDPACLGIEIAEYNPHLDPARRTARLISELLSAAFLEETRP